MGYKQWVHVIVQNKMGSGTIKFKNGENSWGKLYKYDDKDKEISWSDVEKEQATKDTDAELASCGRSDSASGTTGSVDLYDGDTKICHINWNCPYIGTNSFDVLTREPYLVSHDPAPRDGPIGNIIVKVGKMV